MHFFSPKFWEMEMAAETDGERRGKGGGYRTNIQPSPNCVE